MIGIVSAGAHVPRYRLSAKTLGAVWGAGGAGERAVANYDEDSLTMAVEASLNAIHGRDARGIGACFLASTSAPYAEKSSAAILATVMDLPPAVLTADIGGSLRCGTTALRLALDSVKAGTTTQALVAAADLRPVAPGTAEEAQIGDGAATMLVGDGDVIATFEGAYAASHDFTDVWRLQGDRYLNVLPDMTFVKAYGLDKHIAEAIEGLLKATGRKREDIAKLVLYAPDARTHAALVRQLKLAESAKPGDQILVVSYGSGAEALLFQATDALSRWRSHRPVSAQLGSGVALAQYGKLLNFRRHVETEVVRAFASVPTAVREEQQDLRLYGQKCQDCGAVSYPRRHLCWQCSSKTLADYKISRRGKVFTFAKDHLVPSPDPPTVMVSADLEGGGRFYGQLTDCDPAAVTFEMPVELCFRRIHEGEGFISYFWKFRPS